MRVPELDLTSVTTLLCDADGTLFDSEGPAFDASVLVANRYLERLGSPDRYTADELRRTATGLSFRATLTGLARDRGVDVESAGFAAEADGWVAQENEAVTSHLAQALRPDDAVRSPLRRLAVRFGLAVVTSSALTRIDASLTSSGLAGHFPDTERFSAQDSLPVPTSKPDPAVYLLALSRLGLEPDRGLALEDAVPGATSAVRAGLVTVGVLCFVPLEERDARAADLERAGVSALVDSWSELEQLLDPTP
ncbi:HAD family hydrolase [uncultured Friedmanniella sp.]|uniref:HAD family hydrolase n=1 Tax=uncultured Friedmanniella sp. TaxID=335381 RepID=UPI0035CA54F0